MLLEEIFIKNRDKIFAIDSYTKEEYTYYDIYNLAMNYSNKLNIKNDSRVILLLDNSTEFIALYFWAFFNNITILPLSKKIPIEDISKIIIDYSIDFVITDDNLLNIDKEINIKNINSIYNVYDFELMPKIDYNKKLLLMYTSGTTGEPKCIVHSLNTFIENGNRFIEFHKITSTDRFLMLLEMSYMAGYYNMFLVPFLAQSSVVIKEAFKPQDILRFWHEIIKYKVNILWLVPTIIKLLNRLDRNLRAKDYIKSEIKYIFSCTAPLDLKDKINFREKYDKKIFNTYGLSETLFISSENKNSYQEKSNSVGVPIIDINIENSEIYIANKNIFSGYLKSKGSLDGVKIDEKFSTGDLGRIVDNKLYIIGRKKEIIIKGGVNINPKILEDKIKKIDFIEDVAVVGVEDKIFGEKPIAVVVIKNRKDDDEVLKKLKRFSKDSFADDTQIDDFIIFKKLPLNRNNKIDKKEIIKILKKSKL